LCPVSPHEEDPVFSPAHNTLVSNAFKSDLEKKEKSSHQQFESNKSIPQEERQSGPFNRPVEPDNQTLKAKWDRHFLPWTMTVNPHHSCVDILFKIK